jgi:hypothetical protein
MNRITIYEMIILHEYFAKRPKATKADKERANRLYEHLCKIADTMVYMQCTPQ